MATSGDLREITVNHKVLGSGRFFPKSNEDSNWDLGGLRSEDDPNMIDGGRNPINKMNFNRWFVETTIAWDMNIAGTMEFLNALAAHPDDAEYTLTHVNGTVWGGTGRPVGDINGNGNAGTISIKISGGGELAKITG